MNIKRLPNRDFTHRLTIQVGDRIKTAREECGLSQQELAELMGLQSATAISLYEGNRRKVSAIQIWQIACITNLPITYFL